MLGQAAEEKSGDDATHNCLKGEARSASGARYLFLSTISIHAHGKTKSPIQKN